MRVDMKTVVVLLLASFVNAQQLRADFSLGYSRLAMDAVNNYLDNSTSVNENNLIRYLVNLRKINKDVYYEFGLSLNLPSVTVKISGNYLADKGSWQSAETDKSINSDVNLSTFEIIPSIIYYIPIYELASLVTEAGIGYGFASSDVTYMVGSYYPVYHEIENHFFSLSGGYFLARFSGGVEAKLKFVLLRFMIGYKFADPVELSGESVINGSRREDQYLLDRNSNNVEFDFSGLHYGWGISILL